MANVTLEEATRHRERLYVPGCIVLKFYSNAIAPDHKHSNFHRAPFVFLPENAPDAMVRAVPSIRKWLGPEGREFASAEHLYQALASNDLTTFQAFVAGGSFGDTYVTFFMTTLPKSQKLKSASVRADGAAKKVAYWDRKGNAGIVAKLAVRKGIIERHYQHLSISRKRLACLSDDDERAIWFAIHKQKYLQNPKLLKALCDTGPDTYLLEFVRGAERVQREKGIVEKWGGLIDKSGTLYGQNRMGRYLMAMRHYLLNVSQLNVKVETEK